MCRLKRYWEGKSKHSEEEQEGKHSGVAACTPGPFLSVLCIFLTQGNNPMKNTLSFPFDKGIELMGLLNN